MLIAAMAVFGGLSGGLATNILSAGAPGLRSLIGDAVDIEQLASVAGLGLDEVTLTGHRFTSDLDVFDALDLVNSRSVLSFDSVAARARIERLPWVATAAITRIYPGRLDVRISERTPFALWRRGSRHQLVDASGRVLTAIKPDAYPELPRVAGEGAAAEAAGFLALVGRFPALKERLVEAERVGERRWTLNLKGNVVVHLPADREAVALEEIASAKDFEIILGGHDRVVDLRASRRVISRAKPAVAVDTAAALGGS